MNSYALHIPCAVYLWLLVSPWTEKVLRKRAFKGCHRHCVVKEIKSFIFCLPMLVCTSYATTSVIVNNFQGKEKCYAIWYIALHSSPCKSTLSHVCTKYWSLIDRNLWIFFSFSSTLNKMIKLSWAPNYQGGVIPQDVSLVRQVFSPFQSVNCFDLFWETITIPLRGS